MNYNSLQIFTIYDKIFYDKKDKKYNPFIVVSMETEIL